MTDLADYTDTPTAIRVFKEDDHWCVDGVDENGGYTEAVWDSYSGEYLTRERAVEVAPEFAKDNGWGLLPIVIKEESDTARQAESQQYTDTLRGMTASYDPNTRTFSVSGISAKDAHTIIWRGGTVADKILVAIRQALVMPQDKMPNDHYIDALGEADRDA